MKKHILISTLITSIIVSHTVSAKSENEQTSAEQSHNLPTYKVEEIAPPVISKTVAPRINKRSSLQEVELVFRVGVDGRPYAISKGAFSPEQSDFRSLESAMLRLLPYWRFEPALDENNNPIDVKVALPVRILNKEKASKDYPTIALANPTILVSAIN